jgi:coiled-coil domain-containing protein 12
MSLAAGTDERRARLAALREKSLKRKAESPARDADAAGAAGTADAADAADRDDTADADDVASRVLSGRNYSAAARGPILGFEAPPTAALNGPTLEQQAMAIEAAAGADDAHDGDAAAGAAAGATAALDLSSLAPRRANWDLRREADARRRVLDVRTDNAIAALVRARAGTSSGGAVGDGVEDPMFVQGVRARERAALEEAEL